MISLHYLGLALAVAMLAGRASMDGIAPHARSRDAKALASQRALELSINLVRALAGGYQAEPWAAANLSMTTGVSR